MLSKDRYVTSPKLLYVPAIFYGFIVKNAQGGVPRAGIVQQFNNETAPYFMFIGWVVGIGDEHKRSAGDPLASWLLCSRGHSFRVHHNAKGAGVYIVKKNAQFFAGCEMKAPRNSRADPSMRLHNEGARSSPRRMGNFDRASFVSAHQLWN